jgi:hypothetical protein
MDRSGQRLVNLNIGSDNPQWCWVPVSFFVEPHGVCEVCGKPTDADFVDNGFGPYASQVDPWHCTHCGWVEDGCPTSLEDAKDICPHCTAWDYCHGKAAGIDLLTVQYA